MIKLRTLRRCAIPWLVLICSVVSFTRIAEALPSFSRQTKEECSSCHVGAMGGQLTTRGREFKLYGYSTGFEGPAYEKLSSEITFGLEHAASDLRKDIELSGRTSHDGSNNNFSLEDFSIFYAGRLFSNTGLLAEMHYQEPYSSLAWGDMDLRYADEFSNLGRHLVIGTTVNNRPTLSDLWQSTAAYSYPDIKALINPHPLAAPFLNSLSDKVLGLGGYLSWNHLLYMEADGYVMLPPGMQHAVGIVGVKDHDHLEGIAPSWRLALEHSFGPQYVSLGTSGIYGDRYPLNIRNYGADEILDTALDATYQFATKDLRHSVALNFSYLHELQTLKASQAAGISSNSSNTLNQLQLDSTYVFDRTYALTVSRFMLLGSADPTLYPVSPNFKPNSSGWRAEFDYTPFGKMTDYAFPLLNLKTFLQATFYDRFNGSSDNYDGTGRSAADNNLIFLGVALSL